MSQMILPQLQDDEYYHISQQGLSRIAQNYNPTEPTKNIIWTTDYTMELPIKMKKTGPESLQPYTLVEMFQRSLVRYGDRPALSVKKDNKWYNDYIIMRESITFRQYFEESCNFAKGLLSLGISKQSAVCILGFNSPQWLISFYGSIFGFYLPVGIYTNNGPEACQYVAEHSESELVVVENRIHLAKFLKVWDKLLRLKFIVIYNDVDIPEDQIPSTRRNQIFQWKTFIDRGSKYTYTIEENSLESRMKSQKPGNICTLVYTSGTTGQPKGVMLTHDSIYLNVKKDFVFKCQNFIKKYELQGERIVSYLPLSHIAGLNSDIIVSMIAGHQVFFASPQALSTSIIPILQDVRPTYFFSVPRIWEKIEQYMRQLERSNGFVKNSISNWAKGIGKSGTYAEANNQATPFCFGVAKSLVYSELRKKVGLDQARNAFFGAAPLSPVTQNYFLSLNIFLINGYGMTECAGGTTYTSPSNFDNFDNDFLNSTGNGVIGSRITSIQVKDTKIINPDKYGNGEICYKGRHIFRGYLKNEQATRETIDQDGYLHSGDVGRLDKRGNLIITGRIKELIITSGGENIAPVLLENEVKELMKFMSNCMVVGEARKFLAIILTLKHVLDKNGKITSKLEKEVLEQFQSFGSKATSVSEAQQCPIIRKKIDELIEQANKKAISNAHYIQKWILIEGDFTVDGGDLTPTLKLKRNVVLEKHASNIDLLYIQAKL